MNKTDVIINRDGDIFGSELLWCQFPVTMALLVSVIPLPIKMRWRRTEMDGQDTENRIKNFIFRIP